MHQVHISVKQELYLYHATHCNHSDNSTSHRYIDEREREKSVWVRCVCVNALI